MTPIYQQNLLFKVEEKDAGDRLDVYLDRQCEDMSRSQLKKLIQEGRVLVDGRAAKASLHLKGMEKVSLEIPEVQTTELLAQDIKLNILHEDSDLIVINKSAERVVHPGAGNPQDTLVNAILHHCKDLSGIGGELRPGIVHRLDKGTSGVLVIAKNDMTHRSLTEQFQDRSIKKKYLAFVWGSPESKEGVMNSPLGRNPVRRKIISVDAPHSREALTRYRVLKSWGTVSLLELKPETGRTHQIRVHLTELGHPVVGDPIYGRSHKRMQALPKKLQDEVKQFKYQLLHAASLTIRHPGTGEGMVFETPMREEMLQFEESLNQER